MFPSPHIKLKLPIFLFCTYIKGSSQHTSWRMLRGNSVSLVCPYESACDGVHTVCLCPTHNTYLGLLQGFHTVRSWKLTSWEGCTHVSWWPATHRLLFQPGSFFVLHVFWPSEYSWFFFRTHTAQDLPLGLSELQLPSPTALQIPKSGGMIAKAQSTYTSICSEFLLLPSCHIC